MAALFACAARDGRIHFTRELPRVGQGLIPLCSGEDEKVKEVITSLAFKARNADKWYVPNVREANSEPEAVAAIAAFTEAINVVYGMPKVDMELVTRLARKLQGGML